MQERLWGKPNMQKNLFDRRVRYFPKSSSNRYIPGAFIFSRCLPSLIWLGINIIRGVHLWRLGRFYNYSYCYGHNKKWRISSVIRIVFSRPFKKIPREMAQGIGVLELDLSKRRTSSAREIERPNWRINKNKIIAFSNYFAWLRTAIYEL